MTILLGADLQQGRGQRRHRDDHRKHTPSLAPANLIRAPVIEQDPRK